MKLQQSTQPVKKLTTAQMNQLKGGIEDKRNRPGSTKPPTN